MVPGAGIGKGLTPKQPVRLELPVAYDGSLRKAIPYSAVFYDASGQTWTYVNPEPLVYTQRITVDYVEGDMAVLTSGPAAGTRRVGRRGSALRSREPGQVTAPPATDCIETGAQDVQLDHWLQFEFRFLIVAAAAIMVAFGASELRADAGGRVPRIRAAARRDPDRRHRHDGDGGRGAHHRADGADAARHAEPRRHPLPVDDGPVRDPTDLQNGDGRPEGAQLVQERLALAIADLPQSAGMPIMLQPLSSTSRVMKIGLTAKDMSLLDLSMVAYWTIKFRLMTVPASPTRRSGASGSRPSRSSSTPS